MMLKGDNELQNEKKKKINELKNNSGVFVAASITNKCQIITDIIQFTNITNIKEAETYFNKINILKNRLFNDTAIYQPIEYYTNKNLPDDLEEFNFVLEQDNSLDKYGIKVIMTKAVPINT